MLSEQIKKLRMNKNLSQVDLAKKTLSNKTKNF